MKMQVPIRPEVHRAASSSKRVSISLSPSQRHNGSAIKGAVSRPLTPMYKFPDSPIEASTPYNSLAQPIPGSRSHVSVKRHGTPFGEGLTRRLREWQNGRDEGERRSIPLSPPPMRGNTPASIHEISARLATSMMLHGNARGSHIDDETPDVPVTSGLRNSFVPRYDASSGPGGHAVNLSPMQRGASAFRRFDHGPKEFASYFGAIENGSTPSAARSKKPASPGSS